MLRDVEFMLGIVIYTGPNTKLSKNLNKIILKRSRYGYCLGFRIEETLNLLVGTIVIILLVLVLVDKYTIINSSVPLELPSRQKSFCLICIYLHQN